MKSFVEMATQQNDYLEFLKEFEKENEAQSDRGVVLVCISILDEMLAELLKVKLIKDEKLWKEMFGTKGVFGQFDDKVKSAYALGVISKIDYDLLQKMQQVRNKFAHRVLNIAFEEESIRAVCNNITLPRNAFIPKHIPFVKEGETELPKVDLNPIKKDTSPRERFVYAFYFLFGEIQNRLIINASFKVPEVDDFITQTMLIESVKELLDRHAEGISKKNLMLSKNKQLLEGRHRLLKEKIDKFSEVREPEDKNERDKFKKELLENERELKEIEEEIRGNDEDFKVSKKFWEPFFRIFTYANDVIENSKE